MAECTLNQVVQEEEDATSWDLYVDGSFNLLGCVAGLILKGPEEHHIQLVYALYFKFKAFNNEVEYEAFIIGLKLVKEVGAKRLKVFSDSQQVVNQTNGDCVVKGAKMILYHQKVQSLIEEFDKVEVVKIPRSKNSLVDSLSKLTISKVNEEGRTILVKNSKSEASLKQKRSNKYSNKNHVG